MARLRIGIAGLGFMGMIHYLAYSKVRPAKVFAIATRNKRRLNGDWRDIKGNFGPAGKHTELSGIKRYSNVWDMVVDPELDAIDICLPPALHPDVAIAALKAGKHVFCEKPIALRVDQANLMIRAAEAAEKQLLVGHVLPFAKEYAFALSAARMGKLGRLLGGHFKRVISDPVWLKHFYDPECVGGPMVDLHVHDAHFIRILFGLPHAVHTTGRMRGQVVEFASTQFQYDDPKLVVSSQCGVIHQQGRTFVHGFEIHFERATMAFETAVIAGVEEKILPFTVFHQNGKVSHPDTENDSEIYHFVTQLKEVVNCIQNGAESDILDGRLARDALQMCQKQNESVKRRRTISL